MKVLLTGCNGYIGSHLAETLLHLGHSVFGVGRQAEAHVAIAGAPGLKYLALDLADKQAATILAEFAEGAEIAFHTAAQQDVTRDLAQFVRSNVATTETLLEAMQQARLKRLVHSSTQALYGHQQRLPATEKDTPAPEGSYEITKFIAELLTQVYATESDIRTISLRYASVYGGRNKLGAVYDFLSAATADKPIELWAMGTLKKDYVFVDDVIAANVACLERIGELPWEAINIGGGRATTMQELADAIVGVTKSHSKITLSEQASPKNFDCYLSTAKAERLLAYQPTPLKNALERYAKQFKQAANC